LQYQCVMAQHRFKPPQTRGLRKHRIHSFNL
jgi:hypothetical protein